MAGGSKRALKRLEDYNMSPERGRSKSPRKNVSTTSCAKALSSSKDRRRNHSSSTEGVSDSESTHFYKGKVSSGKRSVDQRSRSSKEKPSPQPEFADCRNEESLKVTKTPSVKSGKRVRCSSNNATESCSKRVRTSTSKDGTNGGFIDQASRNSNKRPSPRPEYVSHCDRESSKVTRSEASCSVSSQKDYRPRLNSRPSSGQDKAKAQGRQRASSTSSLEQDDATLTRNLFEQRLERVESELRRSVATQERESSKFKKVFKWDKKIYEDQFTFNQEIAAHLHKAVDTSDPFQRDYELNEGMTKIQRRNKRLIIAERFGWPTAEAYELDPLADDSADEKRLKRAQKDAKKAREERVRSRKVRLPRRNFRYSNRIYQPYPAFSGCSNAFAVDPRSASFRCWRCKAFGHHARFCRAPIPPSPGQIEGTRRPGVYTEKPVQP